ncbi:hypothetical protein V5N11_007589 [Cardamine amara subsp. amara]|uniref:Uncharacterized protein n=1 Tax=Cardamine amara subsp. amara TaxID=228776 RepID=A0ABD0ZB20_CARAN
MTRALLKVTLILKFTNIISDRIGDGRSVGSGDSDEYEFISLFSQLLYLNHEFDSEDEFTFISQISKIIFVVRSMDLNSQPKPESEFMSLITKAISVFYSMDFDSQPKPLAELISYISHKISLANSTDSDSDSDHDIEEILALEPEPELVSLVYQIFSLVTSMESKSGKFISLCPQSQVTLENGRFYVNEEEVPRTHFGKWECLPLNWKNFSIRGEEATRFYCKGCKGKNHEEYEKAPIEICWLKLEESLSHKLS